MILLYSSLNLVFIHYCNFVCCLQYLVSDCKHEEKATNNAEHIPLHVGSECGDQEFNVLQHDASGNAQNSKLETSMHLAAGKGLTQ